MARLIWLLGLAPSIWASGAAAADAVARWAPQIEEAAGRFDVPEDWVRRVIRAESGGHALRGGRPIVSRAGAMGLMQLMPGTWRDMRARYALGPDPHDPRDNILAGTAYLRAMYDRFGYPGLFAAYNAGPARFERHLATGRPLPPETRLYVAGIAGSGFRRPPGARRGDKRGGIFFLRGGKALPKGDDRPNDGPADRRLFVALSGEY